MRVSSGKIDLPLQLVVVCLAAVSCARVQSPPIANPAPSGPNPQAARVATVSSGPVPQPANSDAVDLNRKILTWVTPPADDTDLPLGPGDLIEVSVFDVPEFSNLKLRVPLGGKVTLPLIGTVLVAGLTPTELEKEIRTRLQRDYMHDPQVSVFLTEQKSQRISVVGAVRTGGVYNLGNRLRLADALAMAGGLTEDAGHTVYVIRRVPTDSQAPGRVAALLTDAADASGGKAEPRPSGGVTQEAMTAIDLEALADGKQELNLPLQAGDVVDVPRAGSYYVGGAVEKPGSFLLKTRTTLEQAIVAAGGAKDAADRDDVRLYRTGAGGKRDVVTYSLNDAESGKPTPEIHQEDVIIVGQSTVKAFLYGVRDFLRFGVGATLPVY